ncbi:MAG: hypothetical protein HC915_12595 [Anaerolineae bacterium]|nr:hypothetical protein [Anaerolineae bacterium]
MRMAIVGSSGGMKSVFVQGVFAALEVGGLKAAAYAGASGSAFPAVGAWMGVAAHLGLPLWQNVHRTRQQGHDMGETLLIEVQNWQRMMRPDLFSAEHARLLISVSHVRTPEAAQLTQGGGARKLGRQLLIQAARGDRSWVNAHLEMHLFDSQASDPTRRITPENLAHIGYASLRMLHTSKVPAWVNGQPYIDTSYTNVLPAVEVAALGYDAVIAVYTEPGTIYRDLFQQTTLPQFAYGVPIYPIQPEVDLATLGAHFTECSDEGVEAAYRHGEAMGVRFLEQWPRRA